MTLEEFNNLDREEAKKLLFTCCGSTKWVNGVMKYFPFNSISEIKILSDKIWFTCDYDDKLEAFSHHPKIGEKNIADRHASTREWAGEEQSGVRYSDEAILNALHEANIRYENNFGFIFIVCATGKSAGEMLSMLNERINNNLNKEIQIAAEEQKKITHIRIDKLFA